MLPSSLITTGVWNVAYSSYTKYCESTGDELQFCYAKIVYPAGTEDNH